MPKLFRPYYRDQATGERRQLKKYYAKVRDADGVVRKVPLSANKATAEAMVRRLLDAVERKRAGLGDPFEGHKLRPLGEHLADWEAALRSRQAGEKHVRQMVELARRVFDGCLFLTAADLRASAVTGFLARLRQGSPASALDAEKAHYTKAELASLLGVMPSAVTPLVKRHRLGALGNGKARRFPRATALALLQLRGAGLSQRTIGRHVTAVKAFAGWLVKDRRLAANPFTDLELGNPESDRRKEFAPLTVDEIRSLIAAARQSGDTARGLTGPDRAVLYAVAVTTALRPGELSTLTPSDFLLDAAVPHVRLGGDRTKNGKPAEQALPPDLAAALGAYLGGRDRAAAVWPGGVVREGRGPDPHRPLGRRHSLREVWAGRQDLDRELLQSAALGGSPGRAGWRDAPGGHDPDASLGPQAHDADLRAVEPESPRPDGRQDAVGTLEVRGADRL